MSQRHEAYDSAAGFPIPSRVLPEHVLTFHQSEECIRFEPAAGQGYMALSLAEYFRQVEAANVYAYDFAPIKDFLTYPYKTLSPDCAGYDNQFQGYDLIHRVI